MPKKMEVLMNRKREESDTNRNIKAQAQTYLSAELSYKQEKRLFSAVLFVIIFLCFSASHFTLNSLFFYVTLCAEYKRRRDMVNKEMTAKA